MTGRKTGPPRVERRRPTINDIARLARVSKKTVSRVINELPFVRAETRSRIGAIIDEVGFVPDPQARGLAFRRSFLIGLIYDDPKTILELQHGLLEGLQGTGFELVIRRCTRRNPKFHAEIRAFVERLRLFGIVLPPSLADDARLIEMLAETGCPAVRIAPGALGDLARAAAARLTGASRKDQDTASAGEGQLAPDRV